MMEALLDLLYPPKCVLCGALLRPEREERVCEACLEALPEWDGSEESLPYVDKLTAPFRYAFPIRDGILRLKFSRIRAAAPVLAHWMAHRVEDVFQGDYDVIAYVPCSFRRRWTRGYDQTLLLAEAMARELGVPLEPLLVKVHHTPKQSRIKGTAQRRANVLGAYGLRRGYHAAGKRVLLVDDVCTTGATISECAKTLRLAGAAAVLAVTAAVARGDEQ